MRNKIAIYAHEIAAYAQSNRRFAPWREARTGRPENLRRLPRETGREKNDKAGDPVEAAHPGKEDKKRK